MSGQENRSRGKGPALAAVAALVVVAYIATAGREEVPDVPAEAAGWYGAMALYRALATWAGKRAMSAELHYWKAVN